MAHGHLPQREERGDEQSAGHRQHGGRVLHAGGRHGPEPHHFHLGAPLLLEAALLFHGRVLRSAGAALLHQQGQYPRRRLPVAAAGPGRHRASREPGSPDSWSEGPHILSLPTNPSWACRKGIRVVGVRKARAANPGDYGSQTKKANRGSGPGVRKTAQVRCKVATESGCPSEGAMENAGNSERWYNAHHAHRGHPPQRLPRIVLCKFRADTIRSSPS